MAADLSYSFPRPNAMHRAVRVVASSRPGAWSLAHTLPTLDRAMTRLTGGRTTLSEALAGLPVLVVTSTGRRSGMPRETQLLGIPVGDTVALIGTNFGQTPTPGWVLNLEADPRATVRHADTMLDVVAREATEAERAEAVARSQEVYLGYPKYFDRISGRRVRVLVLHRPTRPPA